MHGGRKPLRKIMSLRKEIASETEKECERKRVKWNKRRESRKRVNERANQKHTEYEGNSKKDRKSDWVKITKSASKSVHEQRAQKEVENK